MIEVNLSKSNKKDKLYKVIVDNGEKKKTIHFGLKNPKGKGTYLDHKDLKTKENWEARHKVRENWQDPYTAGFWAKWLLWNKETLEDSILDIEKKFNLEIV